MPRFTTGVFKPMPILIVVPGPTQDARALLGHCEELSDCLRSALVTDIKTGVPTEDAREDVVEIDIDPAKIDQMRANQAAEAIKSIAAQHASTLLFGQIDKLVFWARMTLKGLPQRSGTSLSQKNFRLATLKNDLALVDGAFALTQSLLLYQHTKTHAQNIAAFLGLYVAPFTQVGLQSYPQAFANTKPRTLHSTADLGFGAIPALLVYMNPDDAGQVFQQPGFLRPELVRSPDGISLGPNYL